MRSSRLLLVAFSTEEPAVRVPEYTRKKVRRPTYGFVMILNAVVVNGSSSEE